MDLNRDDAWALLTEYTKSESLLKHAMAVEAAVRGYARKFGEDAEGWGVTALLPDFDYARWPTLGDHPNKGAEILRETEYLRPAGDLLASDTASVGSQILRVVSAFDELTAGDPAFNDAAIEALYSGPGYVYDPRVLDALERVAGSRVPAAAH